MLPLKNKVWVVDFTKARGPFGPLGFKTLPILGHLQNLLLPLYFWGNVSLPQKSSDRRLTIWFWNNQKYLQTNILIRWYIKNNCTWYYLREKKLDLNQLNKYLNRQFSTYKFGVCSQNSKLWTQNQRLQSNNVKIIPLRKMLQKIPVSEKH